VTKFLEDHPGGDDVLLSSTGMPSCLYIPAVPLTSASLRLLKICKIHLNLVQARMRLMISRMLGTATLPVRWWMSTWWVKSMHRLSLLGRSMPPPKQPHYNQDKTPEFIIKILQFLVPLAILGLAVAVRMYTKSESA